jgi:hypothetical protein
MTTPISINTTAESIHDCIFDAAQTMPKDTAIDAAIAMHFIFLTLIEDTTQIGEFNNLMVQLLQKIEALP